jgi:hypothetical protein
MAKKLTTHEFIRRAKLKHGEIHYKIGRYSKDKNKMLNKLKQTQKHDNIKTEYCINNNIKLIRIPYWDLKYVKSILRKEI